MTERTSLITVDTISLERQQRIILNEVSLSVGKHDFITIIGPNGAGKSVLLKCIIGLIKIDSGAITRKPGLRIGYVPQRLVPDVTLPVTVRRFLSLHKQVATGALEQTATDTGIETLLEKPLYVLSGGELQRVLLARALLNNPELLILDEPAQNLDVSGQIAFYRLLDRLYNERKFSILMVSHDLHMVMASTKQVVCLYHHICCSGEPHVVTKDPEFISMFGDDMARMMAVYHHDHHHTHTLDANDEEEFHHHDA